MTQMTTYDYKGIVMTASDDANACKSGFHGFGVSMKSFGLVCE